MVQNQNRVFKQDLHHNKSSVGSHFWSNTGLIKSDGLCYQQQGFSALGDAIKKGASVASFLWSTLVLIDLFPTLNIYIKSPNLWSLLHCSQKKAKVTWIQLFQCTPKSNSVWLGYDWSPYRPHKHTHVVTGSVWRQSEHIPPIQLPCGPTLCAYRTDGWEEISELQQRVPNQPGQQTASEQPRQITFVCSSLAVVNRRLGDYTTPPQWGVCHYELSVSVPSQPPAKLCVCVCVRASVT